MLDHPALATADADLDVHVDPDADTRTDADVDTDGDTDANDRVHHHARVGEEYPPNADGSFVTLCGLRIHRRPGAGKLPCCPMCALTMGRPCS